MTLVCRKLKVRSVWSVFFAFIVLGQLCTAAVPPAVPAEDSQRYLDDIKTLTADSMEGRGDGTKGLGRAAHLIESRYESLGLEPAGTSSYLQPFTVITGAQLKGKNHFAVIAGSKRKAADQAVSRRTRRSNQSCHKPCSW